MRIKPIIDLVILFGAFVLAWELRSSLPDGLQGPSVLIVVSLISFVIMKLRKLTFRQIGFETRSPGDGLLREAFLVAGLIFVIQFIGIIVIGSLFGNPEQGTAITTQPTSIIGFIVDIVFITWLITGIGEEFFFRGVLINRLKESLSGLKLIDNHLIFLISGIQAIWFGAAHPSQGLSGMLIAGLIGFGLGIYFLKNQKAGLWPLAIAHALIDTIVLTISFLNNS